MRILVHDFSGHPFQAQLSRNLQRRGHEVLHVHCPSYDTGKGNLSGDGLAVEEIPMGSPFARYSPARRLGQELAYGMRFTRVARRFKPDLIVSCNDPLLAKAVSGAWCRTKSVPWIFWLQDLYSVAMARESKRRAGALGRGLGACFTAIERWLLRHAAAVVAITDDFLDVLTDWGVPLERCTVIENWAPLDELPQRPSENAWKAGAGLSQRFVFLYSGTLGLKHDPGVLYRLAEHVQGEAEVVVASEGRGATHLRELIAAQPLDNLHLLPFQPYCDLPDMLGAAEVLIVLLERSAGAFSVPSKLLTYMCAGRAVLAAVPHENLAARLIETSGAGTVVEPGREEAFLEAAQQLRHDDDLRKRKGRAARRHAETHFDINEITDRFLAIAHDAAAR
jgi:colanic acid biosynthesis glycosyl transferase WcaI